MVRMTWRVPAIVVALLLLLVPTLTHATQGVNAPKIPTISPSYATGGVLRLSIPDTSPTVDPALVADEENVELADLLYSGLVRLDASYHIVAAAAASYIISPDHRHYTFYLRRSLRFSNGDPVTARDFVFSITRSLTASVKSPSAPTYLLDISGAREFLDGKAKTVAGLKAIGNTLHITTYWPVPYFLMELTYPSSYALDRKLVLKAGPVDNSVWYTNPIGSGPFRLQSWAANDHMTLVPNKYFYGRKPGLTKIVISFGALPSTGLYEYVSHALDVVSLPAYDRSLIHQAGIHETKMLAIDGIYMDLRAKPFSNPHIRRALTLALDRSTLPRIAMGPTVTPFAGYVPPGQNGFDPQLQSLPFDATAAKRELAAGGYVNGKTFPITTLYYADDPKISKLAQTITRAWHKNLGISIDALALTVNTLFTKAQNNTLPLYLFGWSADYPDPHDWLSLQWKSDAVNNNVHYSNKQFDTLVSAADVTWDGSKRLKLYDRAQQLLINDAAWIPMYIPHRLVYIRPTVANLVLTGYGIIPRSGTWAQVSVATIASKGHRHTYDSGLHE